MRCVIFLLTFSPEVEGEKKRVVLNCEREIKSNKWLAEGNTCFWWSWKHAYKEVWQNLSQQQECGSSLGHLLLVWDIPFCGQALNLSEENKWQIFSLPCWGSKWPVRGNRCVLVRRRVGVCAFSQLDLRKGGVSIPPTKDIRWVEAARKSSKQLWWPSFLMPHVVQELSALSIHWMMRRLMDL